MAPSVETTIQTSNTSYTVYVKDELFFLLY
jgi:hypothetical protein